MNTYVLRDYDGSVWLQHPDKLDRGQLTALLLEHAAPLAAAQRDIQDEGRLRFGAGAQFCYVLGGKVYSYDDIERSGADPVAFTEWQGRLMAARRDGVARVAAAAGFTMLEPLVGIRCNTCGSPAEIVDDLERVR